MRALLALSLLAPDLRRGDHPSRRSSRFHDQRSFSLIRYTTATKRPCPARRECCCWHGLAPPPAQAHEFVGVIGPLGVDRSTARARPAQGYIADLRALEGDGHRFPDPRVARVVERGSAVTKVAARSSSEEATRRGSRDHRAGVVPPCVVSLFGSVALEDDALRRRRTTSSASTYA